MVRRALAGIRFYVERLNAARFKRWGKAKALEMSKSRILGHPED